ncbi:MAG: hypothetical protein UY15_C0001G0047 [Parcubacteria group bacterium GW2011_GWA2_47_9]|nr:MAG: hypothetical protein UY15_C0001G0047 [Parcubacteria group bacterium GW2011_GWA2_47_9]
MSMNARKAWTDEELIKLESLCKSCGSRADLREKCVQAFPQRSWDSIRFQSFQRHPEWLRHLGEQKASSKSAGDAAARTEDDLDIPRKELEQKSSRLLEILIKGPTNIKNISEDPAINIPKESVFPLIDVLRERGYDIAEEKGKVVLQRQWPEVEYSLPPLTKRAKIEALFVQGTCLGLKTQQGDLLATVIEIGEQRGVFFGAILGNLVAGLPTKTTRREYFLTTVDGQAEYVISHFPKASFNFYLLNGPREMSFSKKDELVQSLICSERDDIRYMGDEKIVISLGRENSKVALAAIETQAYTKSYPVQGIAENMQESVYYVHEHSKPFRALVIGGLDSGLLIPRQLPAALNRYNDFDMAAIPTLHRATAHAANKRRGASPVLGCLVLGANFSEEGAFSGFTYVFYDLTAYFKEDDYLEEIEIKDSLSEEAKKALLRLKKKPARRGDLSRLIGRAIQTQDSEERPAPEDDEGSLTVQSAINELKDNGYVIIFDESRKAYCLERGFRSKFKPLDLSQLFQTTVRFVLTSDWHIGHEGERPDLIQKVFQMAAEHKVDAVVCSGNVFEGSDSYSGQHQDLLYHGADAQRKHLQAILPKSDIPLILIGSPVREHDRVYWVKAGHDIVDTFTEIACLRGHKVEYLGGPHGTFDRKGICFDVQHPKGGLPYGQTYRPQRRIEMLVSGMDLISGPKATFIGHLHRAAFMLYKGIAGFLVPCLKDAPEDEYITALDKLAELGAWIVEFAFDEFKNLTKVELEYVPFEPRPEHFRHLNLDSQIEKWGVESSRKKKK